MGNEPPIRSPDAALRYLLKPWETVKSELCYGKEEIKQLVEDRSDEVTSLMDGEDATSELLDTGEPSAYFHEDDQLGSEFHRMADLEHKLEHPSKFDSLLINDEKAESNSGRMSSQLTGWSVGVTRAALYTVVLFLAPIPFAWAAGINLRTDVMGCIVVVASLAITTLGMELWNRYISYERLTCAEEMSTYSRSTMTEISLVNLTAIMALGSAYHLSGPQIVTFATELLNTALLVTGVGIIIIILGVFIAGLRGGAMGLVIGTAVVTYFTTIPVTGPWAGTAVPGLKLAYHLDIALTLFVIVSIALTTLGALARYPATFWEANCAPKSNSPVGYPSFSTFLLLVPIAVLGWTAFGGTIPDITGFSEMAVVAVSACVMPSLTGSLYLLR